MRRLVLLFLLFVFSAFAETPRMGVVLMHGKGGLPDGVIHELAMYLESRGFILANLEMPWSSRRDYDVDVAGGEKQVADAVADVRKRGAAKVFIAGHSQGGLFALHMGGKLPVDGVVAIAPGGNVAGQAFRQNLGDSVRRASELVAAGKGSERQRFLDYEGARGTNPVITTATNYLSWFDPEGAMNQMRAIRALDVKTPVLFIVPTNDTPALLRAKQQMFDALPRNPLTKLYEPEGTHLRAPSASRDEIARWIAEVANR
jgi:pimeloyl-ACP methyl ester carboxylesterase